MQYHTVFDVTFGWMRHLWVVALVALFPLVGHTQLFRPAWLPIRYGEKQDVRGFEWIFFAIGSLVFAGWFLGVIGGGLLDAAILNQRRCQTIAGRVTDFHASRNARDFETFRVAGVQFRYVDEDLTPGFNTTFRNGGPVRGNLPVRICHSNGEILHLEVGA